MHNLTLEQVAQLRAEKLDAARKEGRLRRIMGVGRDNIASDYGDDPEARYYALAGWAAEDAKLAEPESYVVQDGYRL